MSVAKLVSMIHAWSLSRNAPRSLGFVAFADASVLPLPPDLLLVPMVRARPSQAMRFAAIATLGSGVGAIYGYALGHIAASVLPTMFDSLGQGRHFAAVIEHLGAGGPLFVVLAGFSPLSWKLFAIGAGMLALGIVPFVLLAFLGRGARFFLEAWLVSRVDPAPAVALAHHDEPAGAGLDPDPRADGDREHTR